MTLLARFTKSLCFQENAVPFAYNPVIAAKNLGCPIHPDAARFFAE